MPLTTFGNSTLKPADYSYALLCISNTMVTVVIIVMVLTVIVMMVIVLIVVVKVLQRM